MSLRGLRVEIDSLLEISQSFVGPACFCLQHAQCSVGVRVIRINLQRRTKLLFRGGKISVLRQEQPEIYVRFGEFWIILDRLLKERGSLFSLSLLTVKHTQTVLRFRELGVDLQRLREFMFRLTTVPAIQRE